MSEGGTVVKEGAKYSVGVIGCGRKGTGHARGYFLHPSTEVVAAADPDQENLELFCERLGITAGYSTYDEMLSKEKIDIAAPILPVNANPDAVIACAEAGVKAIFSEKPIAAKLEDADRMVNECASRGIPLACGDAYRSFPQFWDARRIMEAGELGDVQSINLYQPTNEISGGGCQGLAVMQMFAEDAAVDWVTGWVAGDPFSDDDQGMGGYVRFVNGIECFIHLKDTAKKGIEVLCEQGVFFSDWDKFYLWRAKDSERPRRLDDLQEDEGRFPGSGIGTRSYGDDGWRNTGFRQMSGIQSIVDSLEKGSEPAAAGSIMRNGLEIAIALRESHRKKHAPVKIPLEDRSLTLYPHEGRWRNKKEVYGAEKDAEEIGSWIRD